MTSGDFEHQNHERWLHYERVVEALEKNKDHPEKAKFPKLFREMCVDLSLAQSRVYSHHLINHLNALVIRGYQVIYRSQSVNWHKLRQFFVADFPRAFRREWRLFVICSLVFWIPFFMLLVSAQYDIKWVQAALGKDGMVNMDSMYGGKSSQLSFFRDQYGSNFMMFCYYIYNNVAIDFRIFAGGIVGGVGSILFLLYNGIQIGAGAGYANQACDPQLFWSFVCGHSSYELIGMIVAGMAGLRVGMGVLHPRGMTRKQSLVNSTKLAMPMVYGAAVLTSIAAVFEGFWSAQSMIPAGVKYMVGGMGWFLLAAYLVFAGRERGSWS